MSGSGRIALKTFPGTVLASLPGIEPEQRILRLANAGSLDALSREVGDLADRSGCPNPFHAPPFLDAAICHLHRDSVEFLYLSERLGDHERIIVFCPVVRRRIGFKRQSVWMTLDHAYCPLGTPLHESAEAWGWFEGCLELLPEGSPKALIIPNSVGLPSRSRGFPVIKRQRASLRPVLDGDYWATMVSAKRKRRLRTARRWLEEKGETEFVEITSNTGLMDELMRFKQLEASGWKGRRGTALAQDQAVQGFMAQSLALAMESGHARLLWLLVGRKPAAGLISFHRGGWVWPWKIAYDESMSAGSPGVLLMMEATRRFAAEPDFQGLDSLASPENETANRIWPDSIDCSNFVIACGANGHPIAESAGRSLERNERARAFAKRGLMKLCLRR